MNFDKYTHSAQRAVQAGNKLALEKSHQTMELAHLLVPLLEDRSNVVHALLGRAEVSADNLAAAVQQEISRLPVVKTFEKPEVYASTTLTQALGRAEAAAKKMGDQFVTLEHLLLGMIDATHDPVGRILSEAGLARAKLEALIGSLRLLSKLYQVLACYWQEEGSAPW